MSTRAQRLRLWSSVVVVALVALALLWGFHRRAGLEGRLQEHSDQERDRILRESVPPPR